MGMLKMLELLLIAVAIGVFLYIYRDFFRKLFSAKTEEKQVATGVVVEKIAPSNIIGKKKFKLIPYKEALEASRQFIYNIAKMVMQKFSPASKENLMELGMRLFNAGVQYIHVVDMFKISFEKHSTRAALAKKAAKAKKSAKAQKQ